MPSGSLHFGGKKTKSQNSLHVPKNVASEMLWRGNHSAEIWRDFLEEGLEEETEATGDNLDQVSLCHILLFAFRML